MCKINEEMYRKEAMRNSVEIAKNLLAEGSTKIEVIAKATKLPLDEVKKLAKEINPTVVI